MFGFPIMQLVLSLGQGTEPVAEYRLAIPATAAKVHSPICTHPPVGICDIIHSRYMLPSFSGPKFGLVDTFSPHLPRTPY